MQNFGSFDNLFDALEHVARWAIVYRPVKRALVFASLETYENSQDIAVVVDGKRVGWFYLI